MAVIITNNKKYNLSEHATDLLAAVVRFHYQKLMREGHTLTDAENELRNTVIAMLYDKEGKSA